MIWNSNFAQWLGAGARSREFGQMRRAWDKAEAYWRASALARETTHERVIRFVRGIALELDYEPALPVLVELALAAEEVLDLEDVEPFEPNWTAIEADPALAIEFRQMLARRRRYAADYGRIHGIVTRQLGGAFQAYIAALPEACFDEWPNEGSAFEVVLIDLIEDPAALIEALMLAVYDDETLSLDLFLNLRRQFERNMVAASGLPPTATAKEHQHKLVLPTAQRNKTPAELVDLYLAGTPFARLFELPVPLSIPAHVRFEHAHVLGGTGHGKTQLLQRMIYDDLEASREDGRSVVVIDSQGDLINRLLHTDLFGQAPRSIADRTIIVDPSDVEFPVCLNLFDAHLARLSGYGPADRERVLNGVVELYENFFGHLLGAELTQKQEVVFRYLARLMLAVPGATIHTLMSFMQDDPAKLRPHIEKLDGSARYFFETEFSHPSFAATRKQILRRLWGVLSTPAFERMFGAEANKIDLFEATNGGKIIFINTAKDLLKREGSALLGRFFINMLAQAALERSVLPEAERRPTFVYIDEAQEYFDDSISVILEQARKYKIALICAHQSLDQPPPSVRSALFSNTSFKCAGGVSAKDARAIADELRTSPDFIESMRRRKDRTEFAAWVRHWTPHAVRLSVPLGYVERQPSISEEDYDALVARNRARYCATLAEVQGIIERRRPTVERPEPGTVRDRPRADMSASPLTEPPLPDDEETYAQPAPPDVPKLELPEREEGPRELGKGGRKHRYLQSLVKELAEQQGFRATIEAPLPGGQIDVLLERDGLRVAVEVSVSTPVAWERENLAKCFRGDFAQVALVLAKSQTTAKRYREAVVEGLSEAHRARLSILYAEELPDFIESLAPAPKPEDRIVKGYRVKVSRSSVAPNEAKTRRDALARLVSQSLVRQSSDHG